MKHQLQLATAAAVAGLLLVPATGSWAISSDRKTHGSFSTSCGWRCAGDGDLVDGLHGTDVWCKWNGDHVAVHVKLRNSIDSDVAATVKTSYWVRDHGRHGSSLHALKTIYVDGNSTVDWTGDAGEPEGVPAGTPIERCGPSLYGIRRTGGGFNVNF